MSRVLIHQRLHVASDDETTRRAFVRCPEDGRWAPVEGCRRCVKCTDVDATSVACTTAARVGSSTAPEKASIAEVMDTSILCIDARAKADSALAALDEHDTPIAVVVDASHHPIGVCSRRDLGLHAPEARLETCMTPFLITMLDGATVADAIDLVVERGVSHVPVLADGRVVGLVTPRAVIRWLAQNLRLARSVRTGRPKIAAKSR